MSVPRCVKLCLFVCGSLSIYCRVVAAATEYKFETALQWYLDNLQKWRNGVEVVAVSGPGSNPYSTKRLARFLERFLRTTNATSLVEASCGHWPSGWQPHVRWPPIAYIGADVLPVMIVENEQFVAKRGMFGFRSMTYIKTDITRQLMPPADILLTKDTLMHLSHELIDDFLKLHVRVCPPRYIYVIFCHRQFINKEKHKNNQGIGPRHFQMLDVSLPPFNLPTEVLFGSFDGHYGANVVQLLDVAKWCLARGAVP